MRAERYESAAFADLPSMLRSFFGPAGAGGIDAACLAVAAPVEAGVVQGLNLPWPVRAEEIAAVGGPPVLLVNDLVAVGHGILELGAEQIVTLQEGERREGAPIAVIAAGTGLGEGYLTWEGSGYRVRPSEGGHADFAPQDPEEDDLLDFLRARHRHVSYERVLSGPGLTAIHQFLVESGRAVSSAEVVEEMRAEDPAAVITRHALAGDDPASARSLALFVRIYGAEAGNLALKIMPGGGVYVAGGIAPRIVPALRSEGFIDAFRAKGRHAPLMERFPVHVVTEPRVGLWGAARAACGLLEGPA